MPSRAALRQVAPPTSQGLSYTQVRPMVTAALRAGLSVLLRGHPGVGKSTLAHDIAGELGLPIEDIRLAQRDPAELGGVYFPDRERGQLDLLPPAWVRAACERPTLVFLDEINAAVTRLHQAAAYQIVLERRVGPFHFHPDTVVLAAGNLEEDRAIVTQLSSALCNRFVHFTMGIDAEDWVAWGTAHGLTPEVLAYISRYGEEALYEPAPYAFPTPRSWAMASTLLDAAPDELPRRRLVASCVGEVAASKFESFCRIYQKVDARKIVTRGLKMDFTRGAKAEPSFIHAALFSVSAWLVRQEAIEPSWVPNVVAFLRSPGLDPEFVFLFLRQVARADHVHGALKASPDYRILAGELVNLRLATYK
jgi:energy-coupling factor transporter ATP-binding protein EcfA2